MPNQSEQKSRKSTSTKGKLAKKALTTKKKSTKTLDVDLPKKKAKKKELPPTKSAAKKPAKRRAAKQASREKKVEKPLVRKTVHNETVIEENNYVGFPTPSSAMLKSFRDAATEKKQRMRDLKKSKVAKASFLCKPPRKGKKYQVDLRIHSPGTLGYFLAGGVDPAPALTRLARVKGLDMIGITDFYNGEFADLVSQAVKGQKLTVLPGIDLCCKIGVCEEVHLTVLYPEGTSSAQLAEVLNDLRVPEAQRGNKDYVLQTDLSEVLETVERHGGIVIPSRVDKTPYRQLAIQSLVEEHGFHAFDVVHPEQPDLFQQHWPEGEFTFFSFSNAYALAQIGSRTATVKLTSPGFEGLKERIKRRT